MEDAIMIIMISTIRCPGVSPASILPARVVIDHGQGPLSILHLFGDGAVTQNISS